MDSSWHTEASLIYINLPRITYDDAAVAVRNGDSKKEEFVLPVVHLVSPDHAKFRFGFSIVYPAGLSKRWDEPFPRSFAEEFTLQTYELNPTVSYKICERFSLAAGLRAIYSEGEVKSFSSSFGLRRDLEGDTTEFGYNVALTARPFKNMSLAATYRSEVELGLEGNATLAGPSGQTYNGPVRVEVPLPAILTIGYAYTYNKTTIELTYDKTYWSAYETLDFNYSQDLTGNPVLAVFDRPINKSWTDTNAYRIGLTHKYSDSLTGMLGFAIDENPVPDNTLGFDLPDADNKLYSIGLKYAINENLKIGGAYLFDDKEERTIPASANNEQGINGTFRDGGAHLVAAGLNYRF